MPRVASDYSKTIIYKLCCKDPTITEIYIGSTTNFSQRKRSHKNSCKCETDNNYNTRKSQFIRANGGFENWSMVQIEEYPCENKRAAELRERYWVEQLQSKLNSNIPFRSSEELKIYNSERHKEYRESNKEQISERNKQYREANKEQISEQRKQNYEANKEQILENQKQYNTANKQKISEYQKQYRIKKKQATTEII